DGGRGCTNRGADARPGADEETAVANRLARVTALVLHVPHPNSSSCWPSWGSRIRGRRERARHASGVRVPRRRWSPPRPRVPFLARSYSDDFSLAWRGPT